MRTIPVHAAFASLLVAVLLALPGGSQTPAAGSVLVWGWNNFAGLCNPPPPPAGLSYRAIAAGTWHVVGLLSDGSVLAWGANSAGQCNVPALPAGLYYVQVSAFNSGTMARLSDGSLAVWGNTTFGHASVPALPAGLNYVELAAVRS